MKQNNVNALHLNLIGMETSVFPVLMELIGTKNLDLVLLALSISSGIAKLTNVLDARKELTTIIFLDTVLNPLLNVQVANSTTLMKRDVNAQHLFPIGLVVIVSTVMENIGVHS